MFMAYSCLFSFACKNGNLLTFAPSHYGVEVTVTLSLKCLIISYILLVSFIASRSSEYMGTNLQFQVGI